MNNIIASILLAFAIVSSGCQTGTRTSEETALSIRIDAEDLAEVGAMFAIAQDPTLLDDFELAMESLDRLASIPHLTPADVITVLTPVLTKIKELRGPEGALYITGAKIVLRRAGGAGSVKTPIYIRALAEGVSAGFRNAIRGGQ